MKDVRNRINKKINRNFNQRQKIISEIKQALDIDFNKISIYSTEIKIFPIFNNPESSSINTNELDSPTKVKSKSKIRESAQGSVVKQIPLFKIDLPDTIIGSQRYYYKDIEINNLSIEELNNLKNDLDYILKEIEKEIDKLLA